MELYSIPPRGSGYVARNRDSHEIVPHDTLQAKVEIPSSHIGFVKVGMPADLSIDFSSNRFGFLRVRSKALDQMHSPPA